jgi:cellulose synthase (UDP-forming)
MDLQSSSAHDAATGFEASPNRAETHSSRQLTAGQGFVVLAYLLAAVWYLTWRPSVFNPEALVFSVAVYAAELFGFLTSLLFLFVCWRPSRRFAGTPAPGMSVDVFVESAGHSIAMLRRTLRAARDMDYPHETWLLDNGDSMEAKALARELGVRYQARADGGEAKLHALRQSTAAFVAVFDADHVPTRSFLKHTLGFFRDDAVAFVQAPRDVCNLDSLQRETDRGTRLISHELSLLFRVIQPGRDYWNAALFCGSCAVVRRKALDAAGGFAARGSGGDARFSLRLHKQGYKSVYVSEPLAVGISPQHLAPFVEERVRRARSAFVACFEEGIAFNRGLTLPQRLCYLATALASAEGWRNGFFYLAPVVMLVTGVLPIAEIDGAFFLHFAPYLILDRWAVQEVSRGCNRTLLAEQLKMARFVTSLACTSQTGTARLVWPLLVLLCLNLGAIAVGIVLDGGFPSSQAGTVGALVLWALVNSSVAAAVLCATRLSVAWGREGFDIPFPARVKFPVDEPVYGIVDHISSAGFRFHGRFPEYVQFGAKIAGELHLPGGALRFTGTIRSFYLGHSGKGERFAKSVGVSFDWVGAPSGHAMDRMLNESELHGRIRELRDCNPTPLSWIERLSWRRDAQLPSRPEHWAPVLIHPTHEAHSQPQIGMILASTVRGLPRMVLAFAPIAADAKIHLSVLSPTARRPLDGALGAPRVLDTPLAPIYAYQFIGDTRARV